MTVCQESAGFRGSDPQACRSHANDTKKASWTQVVDAARMHRSGMEGADLSQGGVDSFNKARLLARKLRQRGAPVSPWRAGDFRT